NPSRGEYEQICPCETGWQRGQSQAQGEPRGEGQRRESTQVGMRGSAEGDFDDPTTGVEEVGADSEENANAGGEDPIRYADRLSSLRFGDAGPDERDDSAHHPRDPHHEVVGNTAKLPP